MKKVGLILILFMLTLLPCVSKTKPDQNNNDNSESIVFVYHIPDNEEETQEDSAAQIETTVEEPQIITSDDVTADTSGNIEDEENEDDDLIESYQIDDMYTDVLRGYAEYNEEEENTITLEDLNENISKLKIKKPCRVKEAKFTDLKIHPVMMTDTMYTKYNVPEYSIEPLSSKNTSKIGGFSAGTVYDQGISLGELEQSSGLFSRYEYKQFALYTAYLKTVNTTNNNYNDNFYFAPEFRINQYFKLKETLSADIAKNRKKAEVVLSINPFGNKDEDRLRFDLGAVQIFDDTNALIKNQFKFSTSIKL